MQTSCNTPHVNCKSTLPPIFYSKKRFDLACFSPTLRPRHPQKTLRKAKKSFDIGTVTVTVSLMNNTQILKNKIEQIVAKGAAIVSFDYNDKRRNGVIGYKPFGDRKWGNHVSKSIVESSSGELFLTVRTNNESEGDGHAYKSFRLSGITNFRHNGETI